MSDQLEILVKFTVNSDDLRQGYAGVQHLHEIGGPASDDPRINLVRLIQFYFYDMDHGPELDGQFDVLEAGAYLKHDIRNLDPDQYPNVSFGAFAEVEPNEKQKVKIFQKWLQGQQKDTPMELSWKEFAATARYGRNNSIMIEWCGMVLCIDADGYCHS